MSWLRLRHLFLIANATRFFKASSGLELSLTRVSIYDHQVLLGSSGLNMISAHWIRNPSSKQFKAADSLATERRWCLSGTPIQNCINDLVSLLRFFKFEPFSNMDVFRQYILEPLRTENVLGSTNPLQMLLQSVCLRRTEKYLNLPAAHYELITLSLHHDEQNLYSDVFRKYRSELDDLVSSLTKMDKKKATLRFSMISELRRLCNHGTLLEPPNTLDDATLNVSCDYCNAAEKDNMAKLNGDSMCPECQRSLSPSTPSHSNSRSQSVQLSSLEYRSPPHYSKKLYTYTLHREPARIHLGLSTKLQSVADNICLRSKRYVVFQLNYILILFNSTDRVSLVFSYWTTTLNLLQTMLEDRGIVLRRIDGSLGNGERLRVLNEFKNDPAISVLLITMQTGAVGLVKYHPNNWTWANGHTDLPSQLQHRFISLSHSGTLQLRNRLLREPFEWASQILSKCSDT